MLRIILALLVLVSAVASADWARVESPHAAAVRGDVLVTGTAGAWHVRVEDGGADVRGSVTNATLRIVTVEARALVTRAGEIGYDSNRSEEILDFEELVFVAQPSSGRQDVFLHSSTPGGLSFILDSCRTLRVARAEEAYSYKLGMASDMPHFHHHTLEGGLQTQWGERDLEACRASQVRADGEFKLVVGHGLLIVEAQERRSFLLGHSRSREGVADAFVVDRYAFAVLVGQGVADILPRESRGVTAAFANASLEVAGDFLLTEASGHGWTVNGSFRSTGDLHLRGAFTVAPLEAEAPLLPALGNETQAYRAEGSFTHVWVDGRAVFIAHTAAGGAATLVAGAAFLAVLARSIQIVLGCLAALYHRIRRQDALDHAARRRLLDIVEAKGWLHFRELQRECGLRWGVFHYHFDVLLRLGYLRRKRIGRFVFVFIDKPPPAEALLAKHGAAKRIRDTVAKEGPLTQKEVAERLGISIQLASLHLRRLEKEGFVEAQGTQPKRYTARMSQGDERAGRRRRW